jgi:methionine-rich copper-binding protein CopC
MSSTLRAALALAALLTLATGALAHAFPDHAVPAVGSTVRTAPTSVRIWFTQELEPAFSTIRVVDAKGDVVASSDKAVDASDRTLLRLDVPALSPGTYRVVWRVLSVDSHVTEGDYKFDVAP